MRLRRALVILDGRTGAEAALAAAIDLAKESGARLHLVLVLELPAPGPKARADAEQYLAETRRRLATQGHLDVTTAVWSGARAAAIVEAAEVGDADVIVMGTDTDPERIVEPVLRGTRRPVLVIRSADSAVTKPPGDALALPGAWQPTTQAERSPAADTRYLGALREVGECERGVVRIVTTIQQAAKHLEHWQAVHVVHAGVGFPKEVAMVGRTIDASAWPTGRQIAEALVAWHEAAERARTAWSLLSKEARAEMLPPP
jgi:nucleotide-binding universal stress UspA family protein